MATTPRSPRKAPGTQMLTPAAKPRMVLLRANSQTRQLAIDGTGGASEAPAATGVAPATDGGASSDAGVSPGLSPVKGVALPAAVRPPGAAARAVVPSPMAAPLPLQLPNGVHASPLPRTEAGAAAAPITFMERPPMPNGVHASPLPHTEPDAAAAAIARMEHPPMSNGVHTSPLLPHTEPDVARVERPPMPQPHRLRLRTSSDASQGIADARPHGDDHRSASSAMAAAPAVLAVPASGAAVAAMAVTRRSEPPVIAARDAAPEPVADSGTLGTQGLFTSVGAAVPTPAAGTVVPAPGLTVSEQTPAALAPLPNCPGEDSGIARVPSLGSEGSSLELSPDTVLGKSPVSRRVLVLLSLAGCSFTARAENLALATALTSCRKTLVLCLFVCFIASQHTLN